MKVNKAVYGYTSPATAKEERLNAARGEAPLKPADRLTAIYVLTHDGNEEVRAAAKEALRGLTADEILCALEETLDPLVIRKVAEMHPGNERVILKVALNRNTDAGTFKTIVETSPENVLETIAKNAEKLPSQALSHLRQSPWATLLKPAGEPAPSVPPGESGERHAPQAPEIEHIGLQKKITKMTVSEKIKLAILGNKEVREILIRDSNRMVSSTVLGNPHITEEEVIKLTASTSTSDELLREVVRNKDWLKNYHIRKNLVCNPKTPLKASLKLVSELNARDLERLAKSKNIPSVLASTARKVLTAKKKE